MNNKSIELAKKYMADNIYGLVLLENSNLTFEQVKNIIDGKVSEEISSIDKIKITNLIDAWNFIIDNKDQLSFNQIMEMHSLVAKNDALEWGVLRTGEIKVSNTDHTPSIPKKDEVENRVETIINMEDPYESACEYLSYAIKAQLFWDGNKRTSLLVAAKILIDRNAGMIHLSPGYIDEFSKKLKINYDQDGRCGEFKNYIETNLIIKV